MRLPRDLSGADLAELIARYGYRVTRQTGSHLRLTTDQNGQHHVTIRFALELWLQFFSRWRPISAEPVLSGLFIPEDHRLTVEVPRSDLDFMSGCHQGSFPWPGGRAFSPLVSQKGL